MRIDSKEKLLELCEAEQKKLAACDCRILVCSGTGCIATGSTKIYEEEELPETVDDIDFLIVMGEPQSPDEDRQVFPCYDPKAEIALIQKAIDADIYIVGYA